MKATTGPPLERRAASRSRGFGATPVSGSGRTIATAQNGWERGRRPVVIRVADPLRRGGRVLRLLGPRERAMQVPREHPEPRFPVLDCEPRPGAVPAAELSEELVESFSGIVLDHDLAPLHPHRADLRALIVPDAVNRDHDLLRLRSDSCCFAHRSTSERRHTGVAANRATGSGKSSRRVHRFACVREVSNNSATSASPTRSSFRAMCKILTHDRCPRAVGAAGGRTRRY
jgi:hypothetical protein